MKTVKNTVADAVSCAFADLQELGSECREVVDNMPESLQQGARGEALGSAADALECINEPDDVPACVADKQIEGPALKKRPSRAARRDHATAWLEIAKTACEEKIAELEESAEGEQLDDCQQADRPVESEAQADIDALQALVDEINNAISEAEGCEFPGMYG